MEKFPKISALVPEKEYFDSSVMGDGIWMTVGHVNAIETALQVEETAISEAVMAIQSTLSETESKLEATEELLSSANIIVEAKESAIVAQTTRIKELEAQVAELGGQSSGTGSSTIVASDDVPPAPRANNVIAFDSPEHPANIQADAIIGRKIDRSI